MRPLSSSLAALPGSPGARLWSVPSLLWIGNGSTLSLLVLLTAGSFFSFMLALGIAERFAAAALFLIYLSFAAAGQAFIDTASDRLLLETGFLTIFLVPTGA